MSITTTNVRHLTINDIYRGKVLVVSPDGNSVDPIRGFSNMSMFTTIKAAVTAATDGDLIYVLPGTYNENGLVKNNINYYFCQGAKLWFTGTGNSVNDNNDIIQGSNITVDGFGDFRFDYPNIDSNSISSSIFKISGGNGRIRGYKAYSRNFITTGSDYLYSVEFYEVGLIPNTVNYTIRTEFAYVLFSNYIEKLIINTVNVNLTSNFIKRYFLIHSYLNMNNVYSIIDIEIMNITGVNTHSLVLLHSNVFRIKTLNINNCLSSLIESGTCIHVEIDMINTTTIHDIVLKNKLKYLKISSALIYSNIKVSSEFTMLPDNLTIDINTCKNLNIAGNHSNNNNNTTYKMFLKLNMCEELTISSDFKQINFTSNFECSKITASKGGNNPLTINPELHFHGNVKINLINPTQPAFTNNVQESGIQMLRFYNYGNIITNSTHTYPFGGSVSANIIDNPTLHKTPGYKWSGATAILESGGIPSRGLYDNQLM